MAVQIGFGEVMVLGVVDHYGLMTHATKFAVAELMKSSQEIPDVVAQPTTSVGKCAATECFSTRSKIT